MRRLKEEKGTRHLSEKGGERKLLGHMLAQKKAVMEAEKRRDVVVEERRKG